VKAFQKAMIENDDAIAPLMVYAYLMEGVPFANGAPKLTLDIPANCKVPGFAIVRLTPVHPSRYSYRAYSTDGFTRSFVSRNAILD
jgi:hypothetical protein